MSGIYELLLFDGLDEVDRFLHFHLVNIANVLIQKDVVAIIKLKLVEEATLRKSMAFLK